MKIENSNLTLKLDRARWHVLQTSPFYGALMMALADVIGNPHGKTACTDGKRIMWNADFLAGLSDEETRFVLLHETLHCAHGHLWRFPAGACDHKTANQACDHAINLTLNAAGLKIARPAGGLADPQFADMAEESIYAALSAKPEDKPGQDGPPQAGNGQAGGAGAGDDEDTAGDPCGDYCQPAEDEAPAGQAGAKPGTSGKPAAGAGDDGQDDGNQAGQTDSLRDKWQRAVIQAAQAAKASGCGNLPADMARELEKIAAVKIDWKAETADFIKNTVAAKNDWTRGNRRHLWQNVVYPSRKRDACGLIIGVRDTSGSIDDKTAAQFSAILAAACAELNAELLLLDCDTAIAAEYRIAAGDEVPLRAAGGGGTDFSAPFERAAELIAAGENVAGLIYLTDLCGPGWPADEVCPALCICTEDTQAPSGRTVHLIP